MSSNQSTQVYYVEHKDIDRAADRFRELKEKHPDENITVAFNHNLNFKFYCTGDANAEAQKRDYPVIVEDSDEWSSPWVSVLVDVVQTNQIKRINQGDN